MVRLSIGQGQSVAFWSGLGLWTSGGLWKDPRDIGRRLASWAISAALVVAVWCRRNKLLIRNRMAGITPRFQGLSYGQEKGLKSERKPLMRENYIAVGFRSDRLMQL
jgi:hypothetical protein